MVLRDWRKIRTAAGAGAGGAPLGVREDVWAWEHQVTGPILWHLPFLLINRPHLNIQVEDFTCL